MIIGKCKLPISCYFLILLTFYLFLAGCATRGQIPKGKLICDQTEERWLPDGQRPLWIDKTPGAKSGFMFFIGQSNSYSNERDARGSAYQDAVKNFAAYCGVKVKVMDQYLSFSQRASSEVADPNIIEKGKISHRYQALVSRIKPIEWAMKVTACLYQKRNIKSSYLAYVQVSVPEDEDKRVQEYKRRKKKFELEMDEKRQEAAAKEMEARLLSVFEKSKRAYASLAGGFLFPALDALANAEALHAKIAKDYSYHLLYPQLREKYGFPCDDLHLQARHILESICLEKVEGDNQTLIIGQGPPNPLTLRAVLVHKGHTIPLKNIPIIFKDSEENTIEVQTDLNGIASYKPNISQPGLHQFQGLLTLNGEDGQNIQRTASFALKIDSPKSVSEDKSTKEDLSLVVTFLYDKGGKVEKMYDGLTLRSERDYYQIYFRPLQDCYVYIFQVDSHGIISRLFPNPEFSPRDNPLSAGNSYYVPTTEKGEATWLYLDRNTGEERIYLLASREEDNEIDSLFARLSRDGKSHQWKKRMSRQIEQAVNTRGPGGVVDELKVEHNARDKRIFELMGDLVESSDQEFFYTISFNHVD